MSPSGVSSAYERLLESGKHLFASRGFSNTSTIMIARAAGTSESQLVKHFGSKDGLLQAIFDHGWQALTPFPELSNFASPVECLRRLLEQTLAGMERDPELRDIFLLEGRRIRRENNAVMLTSGYAAYVQRMEETLSEMRARGFLSSDMSVPAVRSAIAGMCEGLLRDLIVAQRQGCGAGYTLDDARRVVDGLLNCFTGSPRV
jgi:AcrR family transcriptional regulator